ncbi:MAG: HAD family hydrolase [Clostridia bacterium]|nr:HAD family hydrolase [Clostridia bacterium]
MKKAIIWDLDGTMWDSSRRVYSAWNDYMQSQGVSKRFTQDDCRSYCGKTLAQIAEVVFPDAPVQWRNRMIIECCDAECIPLAKFGGDLYDGLEAVLEQLHKEYHMSVVSNCGLGYIEAFFTGNHTEKFFDDYENAARTGLGKAENIRLVMERNHIDKAVYIGDTAGDQKAAEAAGVPFIYAAYGFGEVKDAKWRIDSLRELPAVLDEIF